MLREKSAAATLIQRRQSLDQRCCGALRGQVAIDSFGEILFWGVARRGDGWWSYSVDPCDIHRPYPELNSSSAGRVEPDPEAMPRCPRMLARLSREIQYDG